MIVGAQATNLASDKQQAEDMAVDGVFTAQ